MTNMSKPSVADLISAVLLSGTNVVLSKCLGFPVDGVSSSANSKLHNPCDHLFQYMIKFGYHKAHAFLKFRF